jgi:REP element-mobilizing transposase RayT
MHLSIYGQIVEEEWQRTAQLRPYVRLGAHVVMPNHFHGIIWIIDREVSHRADAQDAGLVGDRAATSSTGARFGKPVSGSLPTVVRAFKAAVTKRIRAIPQAPEGPVWQRNYYEHVIRDEADLDRIRQYVADNPARWVDDQYYGP